MDELKNRIIGSSKINPETGCWIWQKAKVKKGYGKIIVGTKKNGNRKNVFAHRLSYALFKGEIADGLVVCHSCDNPSCINPDHLFLGTNQDNVDDRQKKQRSATVVSRDTVLLIKTDLLIMKQKDVAEKHCISLHIVKDISSGRSWKSVG